MKTVKGRKMKMKKLAVLFISAVVFAVFGITASAEGGWISAGTEISAPSDGRIKINVEYDEHGIPLVSILPSSVGNTLRYTLDGTTPTLHSMEYEAGEKVRISRDSLIRAAEFGSDGKRISGAKRSVKRKTAAVAFELEYRDSETAVRLSCETENAKIYYTADGTKPNEKSSVYSSELIFSDAARVRAYAVSGMYAPGEVTGMEITVSENTASEEAQQEDQQEDQQEEQREDQKEETVKITTDQKIKYKQTNLPNDGSACITLMPSKASNIIYYTTDGSAPSTKSKQYSKRVKFTEPGVLRALEYTKKGELVASLKVTATPRVMPVELVCIDFSVGMRTIGMTTKTPGATIYYTIDGSKPTTEYASVYTNPILISDTTNLRAFAVKEEYKDSAGVSEYGTAIPLVLTDYSEDDPAFSEVLDYINQRRRASGLSDLRLDSKLTYAANIRAKEVTIEHSHNRLNGQPFTSIFEECEIHAEYALESLASCDTAAEFEIEILSRTEEAKVLLTNDQRINSIGVGYSSRNGKTYWVLIAARLY